MATKKREKQPKIFICSANRDDFQPSIDLFTHKKFTVQCIGDSNQAINEIITDMPDAVLLDVHLPTSGGYEVCGLIRPVYHGIIVFVGEGGEDAMQLLAFERGADDYIGLPISPALLAARIDAHLRRTGGSNGRGNEHCVQVGDLLLDAGRRAVSMAGHPVDLTTMQFELLWYLAKRSGRVVDRDELHSALYRRPYNGFDRMLDVYVSRIRKKIGDDPANPEILKTVRGVGYLFVRQDGGGAGDRSMAQQ